MINFIKKLISRNKKKNLKVNSDELLEFFISKVLKDTNNEELESKQVFKLIKNLIGTSILEGFHIFESILKTMNLKGDVCEFGVAQGKTSKLMGYLIKNTNKKLYLFDSFKGLPEPSINDELKDDIFNLGSMKLYKGKMSHKKCKVINELSDIKLDKNQYIINEGFVNKSTIGKLIFPEKVSFAYLDFDFYQPTLDVLNVLEKKLMNKSIVIVDDYDFFSTGVKKVVDEWVDINQSKYEINKIRTEEASYVVITKNE
jgi:O-methyltransferase